MTTRGIRRKKSYLVDAKIAVCGQKSVGKSGKIPPNIHACIRRRRQNSTQYAWKFFNCHAAACYRIIVMFNISSKQKMQMQKWKIFKWKANKSAFHNGFHVESLPFTRRYCRMSSTLFRSEKKKKKRNKRRMRFENVKNSLKRTEGGWRWEKMSVNMRKKYIRTEKEIIVCLTSSQSYSSVRAARAHLELFFFPSLFVLRERWKSLRFGLMLLLCVVFKWNHSCVPGAALWCLMMRKYLCSKSN